MSKQFFLQMSGAPGSGKTTVANAIAKATGAVIIDHDVTKSALLAAEIPVADAGRASYEVLNALADHLLAQGQSVIFDSPCFYENLLSRGQALARKHEVQYRYVECRLNDLQELDRRMQSRVRKPSQLAGVFSQPTAGSGKAVSGAEIFQDWIENMKRPSDGHLIVDTAQPFESYMDSVLAYLKGRK